MNHANRSTLPEFPGRAHFLGFPYLVVRIGHTPLRHLSVLPADWNRDRLLEVARRQVASNRLDACLCLGLEEGVYLALDGREWTASLSVWGVPLAGQLHLPVPLPPSEELNRRVRALAAFIEREGSTDGCLVGDGLEGGRRATPAEVARLAVRDPEARPPGLVRCADCGWLRGEWLATQGEGNGDRTPRVVEIHCRCQNHNRCARCGGPLAASRLSAYRYDEAQRRPLYLAAYAALGHRCGAVA